MEWDSKVLFGFLSFIPSKGFPHTLEMPFGPAFVRGLTPMTNPASLNSMKRHSSSQSDALFVSSSFSGPSYRPEYRSAGFSPPFCFHFSESPHPTFPASIICFISVNPLLEPILRHIRGEHGKDHRPLDDCLCMVQGQIRHCLLEQEGGKECRQDRPHL